jgi:adenine-specific DNA-methyltransferase
MEHKLIVEVDGGQHAEAIGYDRKRDAWLETQGFRVLRFWNNEVLAEMEAVLERILAEALSPNPSPASRRGE